jgi:alpha-glucosidase
MPWTPGPGHGFTGPGIKPWLGFGEDAETRNVETQLSDDGSMLNLIRHLLALRRRRPSLHRGTLAFLDAAPDDVLSYVRQVEGEQSTVLINFSSATRTFSVPSTATLLASTDGASLLTGASVSLAPHAAMVLDAGPDS